ncbi:MAG: hypothetical protein IKC12_03085 [Alistipes sp.]|nr:hypothetical protein [Alistipes sp.]
MRSTSLREYSAPELEVVSTIVEQGFTLSSGVEFQSAGEENYGDDF